MSWAEVDVIKRAIANNSVVKSVQRGIVTVESGKTTASVTIKPVNTEKAVIIPTGSILSTASMNYDSDHWDIRFDLISSTQVTATRNCAPTLGASAGYQVVEYY